MAKFYGVIGYAETAETSPGVWSEVPVEKNYYGDVIRDTRRWQASENLNDNLVVSNKISVVADAYAYQNFHAMRYIKWMGAFWKISEIDVQRPRLILTLGGVYNGPTAPTPDPA